MKPQFKAPLAILALIAAAVLFWRTTNPATNSGPPPLAAAPAAHAATARAFSIEPEVSREVVAGKPLTMTALQAKFHLSDVDKFKLGGAFSSINEEFLERRGLNARVDHFEGKKLEMTIPGLVISDEDLAALLVANLEEAIGGERALSILRDPDGLETVLKQTRLEALKRPTHYRFTRSREENDVPHQLSLGYAAFDVDWEFGPPTEGSAQAQNIPAQQFHGFTFEDTDNIRMGWNAMSKAPSGYFRTEPILGAASRPNGGATVIYGIDMGLVEVLHARHRGSVDPPTVPKS